MLLREQSWNIVIYCTDSDYKWYPHIQGVFPPTPPFSSPSKLVPPPFQHSGPPLGSGWPARRPSLRSPWPPGWPPTWTAQTHGETHQQMWAEEQIYPSPPCLMTSYPTVLLCRLRVFFLLGFVGPTWTAGSYTGAASRTGRINQTHNKWVSGDIQTLLRMLPIIEYECFGPWKAWMQRSNTLALVRSPHTESSGPEYEQGPWRAAHKHTQWPTAKYKFSINTHMHVHTHSPAPSFSVSLLV